MESDYSYCMLPRMTTAITWHHMLLYMLLYFVQGNWPAPISWIWEQNSFWKKLQVTLQVCCNYFMTVQLHDCIQLTPSSMVSTGTWPWITDGWCWVNRTSQRIQYWVWLELVGQQAAVGLSNMKSRHVHVVCWIIHLTSWTMNQFQTWSDKQWNVQHCLPSAVEKFWLQDFALALTVAVTIVSYMYMYCNDRTAQKTRSTILISCGLQ